jgi:hypothetical protein
VKAPKCATLWYFLQPLSSTSATMDTRAQQFDSGKEATEDNGMGAEMLEATDIPASSAMHTELPEDGERPEIEVFASFPVATCPLAAKISTR